MKACLAALSFAFALAFCGWGGSGPAWAAGQGGDGATAVQWVRLSHADFRDLFETHPQGFTLRFYDDSGFELAREFHAPDDRVFLDDYVTGEQSSGRLVYGAEEQFCYGYGYGYGQETDFDLFCWNYFVSPQGYREESADGDIVDFFEIEPGNSFERFWGADWLTRFN